MSHRCRACGRRFHAAGPICRRCCGLLPTSLLLDMAAGWLAGRAGTRDPRWLPVELAAINHARRAHGRPPLRSLDRCPPRSPRPPAAAPARGRQVVC